MKIKHQSSGALQTLAGSTRQLRLDGVLAVQTRSAGWLQVRRGRVWLTRDGDAADHVLAAGASVHLGAGERLVVEPWQAGQAAELAWGVAESLPVAQLLLPPQRLTGAFLLGLAGFLRAAAGRLVAAARNADALARRAQGSIAAGDSMASPVALQ